MPRNFILTCKKKTNFTQYLAHKCSRSTLSPFVAGPNSVKVANPVKKLEAQDIAIDKAYLLSCTNGRSTDFAAAARVFREAGSDGKPAKVHPRVKFYLAPASLAEQQMAEEAGDWQILEQSGAVVLPAGCGPCVGLGRVRSRYSMFRTSLFSANL
jgi:homoaconitate hydratase